MVFACGAGLGAPLGEILTDAIGWRWAFIAQGSLCAIAIFWISYIYALASDLAFSPFLYVEQQIASRPLTPLRRLFGKDFLGAYLALAFGNVGWYGVIFYVPLLYQATGHFSPSAAGSFLLLGISSVIIGGFVGGAMVKRRGGAGFRDLALASYPLVTVACAGVAACAGLFWADQLSMLPTVLAMSLSLIVGGLGNGGGMTATLVVVVSVASPEDQAIATACIYLYRQLGATVGLAVVAMVFRRVLAATLMGISRERILRRSYKECYSRWTIWRSFRMRYVF
ncbi:hypothetical protein VTI28DRAFT_3418 [Corynascus sepedonium]